MGRLIYMDNSNREVAVPFGPDQPVVTIGRATDCVIRSNRRSVSRHHAEFRYLNGQFEVVDLGSANGTYLIINENRQRIEGRLALTHNDEVWCGDFILYFEEDEEDYYDPPAYHAEQDIDSTYGDHNPIPAFEQDGGYQSPPLYDHGSGSGYEPPQQEWNQQHAAGHPGAAPFGSSAPPPSPASNGANFGAEPYHPASPQEPPYDPGSSGNYGVEAYDPAQSGDYHPAEPPPPAPPSPGQAIYPTPSTPHHANGHAPSPQGQPWSEHGRPQLDAPAQEMIAPAGPSHHELEALRQQVEGLTRSLDQSRQEGETLREELERAKQEQSANSGALVAEIEELKGELKEASSSADEALQKQLADRDERIEGYRRRITQAEEEATRASRLREDLRAREKDIEQLHQEVDRQREEARIARDEARKSRESAERARQSLQTAERAAQEGADLKKEIERHKRLLDEIERRNRDLTSAFQELESLSKELEQMLEEKTSEAESLRTLANSHEKRLSELSTDSSKFNHELSKTRIALDDALHKKERFEVLSTQLKQELEALKSSSSQEITDLSERLDVTSRDNSVTIAKLTNQRDALTEERDALQAKLEAVEPKTKALKSEIEGLKQRLRMEKGRTKQQGADAEALERATLERDELRAQLDEARARATSLTADLESARARLAQAADPAEIEQLRLHNQSLRERIDSMEQHLDDVSSQATVSVPALHQNEPASLAQVDDIIDLLDALDRVVDAIARTDLSPLGTVDRIRLQSALRDTNPRGTLEEARALLRASCSD